MYYYIIFSFFIIPDFNRQNVTSWEVIAVYHVLITGLRLSILVIKKLSHLHKNLPTGAARADEMVLDITAERRGDKSIKTCELVNVL